MRVARFHTIFSFQIPGKLHILLVKGLPALLLLLCQFKAVCQCPPNIGFENGNFDRWVCSKYPPVEVDNVAVPNTGPLNEVHKIFKNSLPTEKDPFGGFPVNSPNGSGYSLRLGIGDGKGNASAQRVSYNFTVPQNQNEYSIVFHYAIVLMNSNHSPSQEPRFTVRIFDLRTGTYNNCKSLEFKASNTSFITTSFGATSQSRILYTPWASATINLSGMAGKNLALEFTTSDCTTNGQHPCYAYIDVDENCSASLISGNTYCKGDTSLTMKGPNTPGTYTWYASDFSKALGRQNILTLSPAPAPGTKYALVINPTPGFGCTDTIYTTVQYSGNELDLQVKDTLRACFSPGVDLTAASVTNGSSPDLTFSYYTNSYQTTLVPLPKHVQDGGLYYIAATNTAGCRATKPVS
ncbi:MAG: hypothetical protein Q8R50_03505, partial [Sediminibacterium sp.]|nr:hypothetical protein [Sediminibacterium sp.]